MPEVLTNPLFREHAQEILKLEDEAIRQLLEIHQSARAELRGRLSDMPGERFSAQQLRIALIQVEITLRSMIERLRSENLRNLDKQLATSVDQVAREIAYYEPQFRRAQGAIQTAAFLKLSQPRGLLIDQFDTSIDRYRGDLRRIISQKLRLHALTKSTWKKVATDITGRLRAHAMKGSEWKALRIVRTEMNDAISTGHQAGLEAAKEGFLPKLKRQWDATLDTRTSEICNTLNGQVKELDEPWRYTKPNGEVLVIAKTPAHPNERSRILPYMDHWAEQGPGDPSPEPMSEEARRSARLAQVEDEIRGNEFETAFAIRPDGSEMRRKGKRSSVSFSRTQLESLKGAVLTHNHPRSSSFSPEDILLTSTYELAEIRVVSRKWDYSMRPGRLRFTRAAWDHQILPTMRDAEARTLARLSRRVRAGRMPADVARARFWHDVWTLVADTLGMEYTRVSIPQKA